MPKFIGLCLISFGMGGLVEISNRRITEAFIARAQMLPQQGKYNTFHSFIASKLKWRLRRSKWTIMRYM